MPKGCLRGGLKKHLYLGFWPKSGGGSEVMHILFLNYPVSRPKIRGGEVGQMSLGKKPKYKCFVKACPNNLEINNQDHCEKRLDIK